MSSDWNVVVTSLPGREHERLLLRALVAYGEFHRRPPFKDVCVGRVADVGRFLDEVEGAVEANEPWVADLGRVIPVERTFHFKPENLAEQLKEAVGSMLDRISGTFYVRVERRGLAGKVLSQEVESAVGDHLLSLAASQGKRLSVSFEDANYIVCAETIGDECGVALISRELRQRYRFVHVK